MEKFTLHIVSMGFIMMLFDDYHVLSASFELLCAALLLFWQQARGTIGRWIALSTVGVLCGLCLLNRLNDGGLLILSCLTVVVGTTLTQRRTDPVLSLNKRLAEPAVLILMAAGTVWTALTFLHESFADWKLYSITRAAAIKGGTGHVLLYPLRLPLGTVREFASGGWRFAVIVVYLLCITALAMYGQRKFHAASNSAEQQKVLLGFAAVAIVLSLPLYANLRHDPPEWILLPATTRRPERK